MIILPESVPSTFLEDYSRQGVSSWKPLTTQNAHSHCQQSHLILTESIHELHDTFSNPAWGFNTFTNVGQKAIKPEDPA